MVRNKIKQTVNSNSHNIIKMEIFDEGSNDNIIPTQSSAEVDIDSDYEGSLCSGDDVNETVCYHFHFM